MVMPNVNQPVDYTTFPKFPTQFTDVDAKRLQDLAIQRTAIEKSLNTKFNPQIYAQTNPIEKAARTILGNTSIPSIPLAPDTWNLDFGYTPDQVLQKQQEIEQEYKDLLRKKQVTQIVPSVQDAIRYLALSTDPKTGLPNTVGEADFTNIFKLDKMGFNQDEINSLVAFAQRVKQSSPEQIATGEVMNLPPITEEEAAQLLRNNAEPRQVYASIALSKSLEDVTNTLKSLFNPSPKDSSTAKDKIVQDFTNKAQGVDKQKLTNTYQGLLDEVGVPIVLTDDKGNIVAGHQKPDGSIWTTDNITGKESILGYADPNKEDGILPIDPRTGKPLTPDIQESYGKDLWDAWTLASKQALNSTGKFFTSVLPDAIASMQQKSNVLIKPTGITKEVEYKTQFLDNLRTDLKAKYDLSTLQFEEWKKLHPELVPPPELTAAPTSVTTFLDPKRIGYLIVSNAPMMVAGIVVGVGTTVATGGNAIVGALAAGTLFVPQMSSDLTDSIVAAGGNFEDATVIASTVGAAMGAVEAGGDYITLGIMSPTIKRLLGKEVTKQVTSVVTKKLLERGLIGAGIRASADSLKITTGEILEENIQQIMQNATVKVFNENQSLTEGLDRSTLDTFWAVSPMSFMGGMTSFVEMKHNLPKATQEKMTKVTDDLQSKGIPEEQANAMALEKVLETEKGKAEVEQASIAIPTQSVNEMPSGVLEITPDMVRILPDSLVYTNNDVTFQAKNWADLDRQIKEFNRLVAEPSPQTVQVNNGQITYTDTVTGKVLSASSWEELNSKILTLQKTTKAEYTTENLWKAIVKGSMFGDTVKTPEATVSTKDTTLNQVVSAYVAGKANDLTPEEQQFRENNKQLVENTLNLTKLGENIAKQLGIKFDGLWDAVGDSPQMMSFTDTKIGASNGASFTATTAEEAKKKLVVIRRKFSIASKKAQKGASISPTKETATLTKITPSMVIVEPNSPITPENVVAKLSQSKLDKIAELKAKLVRIDEDIAQLNKSIELQEARKDKMAMPYEKEEIDQVIDSMIDQVAELQGKQENIHKKLKIMNTPNQPSGKNSKITTIKPRTVNPAISGLTSHLRTLETNAKTKFPSNPAVKELGRLLDIGSTEALAEIDHKDLEAKVITLLDLRFLGVSKEIKKKLIAWLNEVPYSVKAYITGFKFLDKQKPPSYFSLNGMIVLTPGSINRITLFHEIHHGIMTEMFNNFSFDYFQYYVDHTEIDLGLGNIKKLFRTTAIEHSIMDNTSIDSWLYTHNKVYKETVEGMSERFAEYIIGKGRGSEPDHVEFFNKFFPKDTQLTVQPEVSHEKVDGYDIMTDEQGRNIICE